MRRFQLGIEPAPAGNYNAADLASINGPFFSAMSATGIDTATRSLPDDLAPAHKFVIVLQALGDQREQDPWVNRLRDGLEFVRVVRNEVVQEVAREHVAAATETVSAIDEIWCRGASAEHALENLRAAYAMRPVLQLSLVHERTIFARHNEEAASVKRLSALQRKPGLSRLQFGAYWHDVHAPMARCHRHVSSYVQNHVLVDASPGAPFDGFAEFRITDVAAMQVDYESDGGKAMRADVQNFAATVSTFVVREKRFETRLQLTASST